MFDANVGKQARRCRRRPFFNTILDQNAASGPRANRSRRTRAPTEKVRRLPDSTVVDRARSPVWLNDAFLETLPDRECRKANQTPFRVQFRAHKGLLRGPGRPCPKSCDISRNSHSHPASNPQSDPDSDQWRHRNSPVHLHIEDSGPRRTPVRKRREMWYNAQQPQRRHDQLDS